jgi:hypothetical protein
VALSRPFSPSRDTTFSVSTLEAVPMPCQAHTNNRAPRHAKLRAVVARGAGQ